ncbi:MAG: DNA translocase FtsK [Acetobacteraceae bacterium]|nr:DNA translocase FtsK [Acetobacteraceae bacterium]
MGMAGPGSPPEEDGKGGGLRFELWGLLSLAFGALCLLSLFFPASAGAVGYALDRALRLLLGQAAALVALTLAGLGGAMVFRRRGVLSRSRIAGLGLAVMVVAGLMHLRVAPGLELEAGLAGAYGGVLGGFSAWVLRQGFGEAGGVLVLAACGAVAAILITGLSLIAAASALVRRSARLGRLALRWIGRRPGRRPAPRMEEQVAAARPGPEEPGTEAGTLPGAPEPGRRQGRDRVSAGQRGALPRAGAGLGPGYAGAMPGTGVPGARPGPPAAGPGGGFEQISLDSRVLYQLPPLTLLARPVPRPPAARRDAAEKARMLEEILDSFGVRAKVVAISRGPVVTRFELQPAPGVKVSRIVSLASDIALGLAAPDVRIEAPIPGKAAVGVEVPNREVAVVWLREVLESEDFGSHPSRLAVALGKDIAGRAVVGDLEQMVHLLIAGATGSGKSVCLNCIIASLLFKASPEQVRLLLIDPKVVELSNFNGIPHLLAPVVTEPRQAASCLKWLVHEMERRYELFAAAGAKDIARFNRLVEGTATAGPGPTPAAPAPPGGEAAPQPAPDARQRAETGGLTGEGGSRSAAGQAPPDAALPPGPPPAACPLPYLVVVIDELADLMMVSPVEVEDAIHRLAQMARAAGIHLVVATQRPSVDVITGVIKANIPSRIAFAVSSQVDSRTILDTPGAERLLGRGDMLYLPAGSSKPLRVQGAYISDREVEDVVAFVKRQGRPAYLPELGVLAPEAAEERASRQDPLLGRAARVVLEQGQASVSLLQRKLRVGYARAARMLDELEERGYVGRYDGSRAREVRITREELRRAFGEEE